MRYVLTGADWSAEEAYRMGLVQELTAPGQQLDWSIDFAKQIAAAAPLGVRALSHRHIAHSVRAKSWPWRHYNRHLSNCCEARIARNTCVHCKRTAPRSSLGASHACATQPRSEEPNESVRPCAAREQVGCR